MRARTSSGALGGVHIESIHQVMPASAKGRTMAAAPSGSSPGVRPSQTMSNGVESARCSAT